jgi:hypothetical protein
MLRTIATTILLFSFSSLASMTASAQAAADPAMQEALPPPPGPYVSSRPQLNDERTPRRSRKRMPVSGNMPVEPLRYMPSPRQMPAPPQWWRGPMGR